MIQFISEHLWPTFGLGFTILLVLFFSSPWITGRQYKTRINFAVIVKIAIPFLTISCTVLLVWIIAVMFIERDYGHASLLGVFLSCTLWLIFLILRHRAKSRQLG